jgi:hypothetical protein
LKETVKIQLDDGMIREVALAELIHPEEKG